MIQQLLHYGQLISENNIFWESTLHSIQT